MLKKQKIFFFGFWEIVSFLNGAMIMIFEILGARILGPFIGTSLFVWTSIIAVILGALSYGYVIGGRLADTKSWSRMMHDIYLSLAGSFLALFFFKDMFLDFIIQYIDDVRILSLISSLILLSIPSFFLWLIPPIITKSHIHQLSNGGAVIWKFEWIGTMGSIFWTLITWFILIPTFGVGYLLLLLALLAFTLSCLYDIERHIWQKLLIFSIWAYGYISQWDFDTYLAENNYHLIDTPYSHVTVFDSQDAWSGRPTRSLQIDTVSHAGMYLDSSELLYDYTKYYHLFNVLYPNAKKVVMFWGAAYSFPKSFLQKYPDKDISVVEIDAGVTEIARKFFWLIDNPHLQIYHQDARVFLNTQTQKYDAILGDAFGSFYSIPYQLTTLEVAQKKYDMLSDNGVVILNTIGTLEWEKSQFVRAEYATYKQVFPEVFILPVVWIQKDIPQNIMIVALKNPETSSFVTKNPEYEAYLSRKMYLDISEKTPILTDDFAPVDYYIASLAKQ